MCMYMRIYIYVHTYIHIHILIYMHYRLRLFHEAYDALMPFCRIIDTYIHTYIHTHITGSGFSMNADVVLQDDVHVCVYSRTYVHTYLLTD